MRDDRRLVIMGAGTSGEDKSCTLGNTNRRVGILDAVIPKMGRSKDPEPKMRSRDGLAWNARWKVRSRGKARKRGYEGEPEGDRMGEGLPSVLRALKRLKGLKAEETIKGGTWGARTLRNGRRSPLPS